MHWPLHPLLPLSSLEQVNDRIMLLILSDLLGAADNDPPEDSLEVMGEE